MRNEFDANQALASKADASWMRPAPVRRRPHAGVTVTGVAMVVVCALVAFAVMVLS